MKDTNFKNETIFLILFAALSIYRFSFCGFFYLPYLDDYVQYYLYPSIPHPFKNVLFGGVGTAFTRPLAAVLDIYIWSLFKNSLPTALIILCTMFSISGIFFYKALKLLNFEPSSLFLVFYTLTPSLSEGTFWISAATRIVPSMFFLSVSLFVMLKDRTLSGNIIFCISNLFSMCFYEQTAILSFFCVFLIFLSNFKKFFPQFLLASINVVLISVYYLIFAKSGDNAARLSFSLDIIRTLPVNILHIISLLKAQFSLYTKGFLRSINMIFNQNSYLWLIILIVFSVFTGYFIPKNRFYSHKKYPRIYFGLLLFFVPLLPFFILKNPWLNFRNIVPSALGFAIIADAFFSRLSKFKKPLFVILSVFLIICNVCEVSDYTKTMLYDYKLIHSIAENPDKDINNPNIYYYPETTNNYLPQTIPFNDHIMSITGSDWGLTGTVRTITKNPDIIVERTPLKK